jgi:uncharacterized cupredoxin-like copper-binding protein
MPHLRARRTRVIAAASVIALAPIGLVACGGDEGSTATAGDTTMTMTTDTVTTATTGTATVGTGTAAAGTAQESVNVVLGSPGEFSLGAPRTIPAGETTFRVTNEGAAPHELAILKTDTGANLTVRDGRAEEPGLVDRTAEMAPGSDATLTVTLEPGRYVLICNLPGHYQGGMWADLTVS